MGSLGFVMSVRGTLPSVHRDFHARPTSLRPPHRWPIHAITSLRSATAGRSAARRGAETCTTSSPPSTCLPLPGATSAAAGWDTEAGAGPTCTCSVPKHEATWDDDDEPHAALRTGDTPMRRHPGGLRPAAAGRRLVTVGRREVLALGGLLSVRASMYWVPLGWDPTSLPLP